MNSIHRVGVTVASFATVAAVAGAFVAQGYLGARSSAAPVAVQATVPATADPTPGPTPTLAPETVYINPMPTPAVIHVSAPAKKASKPKPPPVVHVVVPGPTGGDDGGGGGGDN
jgi:hypothetical protein